MERCKETDPMTRRPAGLLVLALLAVGSGAVLALDDAPAVKITSLLQTTESWDGKQLVYPEGQAELTALLVEIAPGGRTGWHLHPVPSFAYVLQGTLEVSLTDGRVKRLQAGDALAEVFHTLHNGRALGDAPVRLVVFYAGAVGTTLTINQGAGAGEPR
jgi:quercetin dioxygenase-like cupin family protein